MSDGAIEAGREILFRAVTEAVERLGYECVHVSVKTDSARPRLQVLIDTLGGINVADCETVSKALNRILDEKDLWPDQGGGYYLEVSSPGLERPLFTLPQYARFCGKEARLRLNAPIDGRKSFTGEIVKAEGGCVTLYVEDEEREVSIPIGEIKNGSLVFRGLEPESSGKKAKGKGKKPAGGSPRHA